MKIQSFILFFLLAVVFALQNVKAQHNLYPNEIENYKFYKSDKLKGLILANSTKDNIVQIFGKECYAVCDYNDD